MNKELFIYHHNDDDGKSAAAVVYQHNGSSKQTKFKEVDYPDKFPMDCFNNDEVSRVYLVDLSFGLSTFNQLKTLCLEKCEGTTPVFWIDHHATSLDLVKAKEAELKAIPNLHYVVNTKVCGALLTYLSVISGTILFQPDMNIDWDETGKRVIIHIGSGMRVVEVPPILLTIDDYDCWKRKFDPTDDIILGLACTDTSPTSSIWNCAFSSTEKNVEAAKYILEKLENDGKTIHKYLNERYTKDLEEGAFIANINGHRALVINTRGNSWCFQDKIKRYPFVILYTMEADGKYHYSIYKDLDAFADVKVNCKDIATAYGGGGHPGASGFQSEYPIFRPINGQLQNKVFLGGTCVKGHEWRTDFIHELDKRDIANFNPVVEDWTEDCQRVEEEEKKKCFVHLYMIIPQMTGVFSIAEVIESANNHSGVTIFCCPKEYDGEAWTESQFKSMKAVAKLVQLHGGYACDSLTQVVNTIVSCTKSTSRNYTTPK